MCGIQTYFGDMSAHHWKHIQYFAIVGIWYPNLLCIILLPMYKTLSTFRPKNNSKETGIFIQQATLIGISVNASKRFQSGESDLLLQSSGWLPRFCTLRRQWRNRFFRKINSAYKSKACPNNYLDWCRSLRKQVLN